MSSKITFTPIYGARKGPMCYILAIDNFHFLLDCGWSMKFDISMLEPLKPYISKINAVLLSHPDLIHLGALPFLVGKWGLKAPIYSTIPVYKMGQMFMYDAYQSKSYREEFDIWNLDDVDATFADNENFIQLKYQQRMQLGPDLEITPHAAGHMMGGTVWKIVKETDEVVYAVDYNHQTDRHLRGTVIESLSRPSLLITDAFNSLTSNRPKSQMEKMLLDIVMATLRSDGNVLIPVDTAGRVLELMLILDQHWSYYQLTTYSLALLTNVSYNTIDFAKSQLEWMSEEVIKSFDYDRSNVFALKYAHTCHSVQQVLGLPGAKVVLCSMPDLESGFSLDLFLEWANNPRNTIILTERPEEGTLAHKMFTHREASESIVIGPMMVKKQVPLEGEELDEHLVRVAKEKEIAMEEQIKREKEEVERARIEADAGDVSRTEEDLVTAMKPTEIVHPFSSSQHDWFITESRFPYPMFPYEDKRRTWDHYGEVVDVQEFVPHVPDSIDTVGEFMEDQETVAEAEEPVEVAVPMKYIVEEVFVTTQCNVQYVQLEGRSDGNSIKTILSHISPRKIVLVHGNGEEIADLKIFCETDITMCKEVLTPAEQEEVDVTSDTNIYRVKLSSDTISMLDLITIGPEYELSYISGQLQEIETKEETAMELVPCTMGPIPHPTLFVGDARFMDFKVQLGQEGFKTDLVGGFLVANEVVKLTKNVEVDHTEIKMTASLCDDYYKVRDRLYSQFSVF